MGLGKSRSACVVLAQVRRPCARRFRLSAQSALALLHPENAHSSEKYGFGSYSSHWFPMVSTFERNVKTITGVARF